MESWKVKQRKMKKRKMKQKEMNVPKFNVGHIAVHKTATKPGVALKDLDSLPFHYLIKKSGELINLKPLLPLDGTIEVALSGGIDNRGNHVDDRTEGQNETLFNTLVMLTEAFPDAKIVGAGELYVFGFPNPGFDVRSWVHDYIPEFLQAA
jgi:hypothetical protein